MSLIPHWADSDEVLQEATVIMWQKFKQFEPGTNFLSWGFKIIHLVSKDYRKRQGRSRIQFSGNLAEMLADTAIEVSDELALRQPLARRLPGEVGRKTENAGPHEV